MSIVRSSVLVRRFRWLAPKAPPHSQQCRKWILGTGAAELGPLDVQLVQRDEIGQIRSGLVVRTALGGLAEETWKVYERVMLRIKRGSRQAISFEVASRIAATIATGVMTPVYAQINPEALGNDLRDLNVATAYGDRLVEHGGNAKPNAVRRLVEEYPTHKFIIDKSEAKELFYNVSDPQNEVFTLISDLGPKIYSEQEPCFVARLDKSIDKGEDRNGGAKSKGAGDSEVAGGRQDTGESDTKRGRGSQIGTEKPTNK